MKALDELVAQKLPRLHAHFQAIDLDMSMLATDWYLGLYCTSFPSEVRTARMHPPPRPLTHIPLPTPTCLALCMC